MLEYFAIFVSITYNETDRPLEFDKECERMKKVLFCLPAVIYTIAVIVLNIILKTFSPLWYVWIVLLWLGGFLLNQGKVWGGLFGLLLSIHLLYMCTQSTGQVINIE